MTLSMFARRASLAVVFAVATIANDALAQEARALLDVNTASEQELSALPHLTPAIAKELMAKRPFASIRALNAFLLEKRLTQAQATELYGKAFVRVGLNKGTREEFMLIPGVGARMAHEFEEYRPWKTRAQFEKEIGKYVDAAEVARLWRYVVIE
jgi:DNA uptake protein ComE-like DNA-binding protein